MPEGDDLKAHALSGSHDFYELLSIPAEAQASEIRRAYRKTAPKYHPDKVGNDPEALEKFYLVQIAYDVLSDPTIREIYDNARKARLAKAERDSLFEGRRKAMKEDLERRENGAVKRRRDEVDEEEAFARELRRLAEDGKRRRKEREEILRREAEDAEKEDDASERGTNDHSGPEKARESEPVADIDRSITLRYPITDNTQNFSDSTIRDIFVAFGPIDDVILREKKIKTEGEKHRRPYKTAIIVFHSIVGAHAAISDFPDRLRDDPETYSVFEAVGWAGGKEPEVVPKMPASPASQPTSNKSAPRERFNPESVKPLSATAGTNGNVTTDAKAAPSFGSFKGAARGSNAGGGVALDEITLMRLKNAERRRLEEKIRKEEAVVAADDAQA